MNVFNNLVGQPAVVAQLERAARAARRLMGEPGKFVDAALSQAWLITGPPGSGRSVAARMFAASLQCTGVEPGCGVCHGCVTTMEGKHPDVDIVATRGVVITVEQTRNLVGQSYVSPGSGAWRVIIIEDADRMLERTTNVLLKAIEEPPPFTMWLLCTPSPEDVMQTIRSRCREVHLAIPAAQEVARLLEDEGVEPEAALNAAFAAQSHIGRARGLARDEDAAAERQFTLQQALGIRSTGDAVLAAYRVVNYSSLSMTAADKGAGKKRDDALPAALEKEFQEEMAQLRRELGVDEDARVPPPAVRGQLKALEEEHKRRVTRLKRDRLDRVLVDLLALFRDVLTVQLGAEVELINRDFSREVHALAADSTVEQSIRRMDAISQARERLMGNGQPLTVFEAMFVALRPQG